MAAVELICLANSRKHGGRCVAGLRLDVGGWLRPVDASVLGSLLPRHYRLNDGSDARLLDILRVNFGEPRPDPHQPENVLLGRAPWQLVARPAAKDIIPVLKAALVTGPELLGNCADRLSFPMLRRAPLPASLALIAPHEVAWQIGSDYTGNRQVRARFALGGVRYDLSVTDPVWEERLKSLPHGEHSMAAMGLAPGDRVLLTISVGEPFGDDCYKLVAAVSVFARSWWR